MDLRFRATPRGPSCLIDVPRGLEDKLYQGDLRQRCDAVPAPVDCGLRLGINQLAIPIEAQKRPPGVVPARDQVAARQQILGCGLTTAEIVYRRPDRHWLLQTYVWQDYDLFPNFPALRDFLAFWETKLEGPLFAVTVAHSKLIKPAELRAVDGVFRLH